MSGSHIGNPHWYVSDSSQNEIWMTASAYLEAAEVLFEREAEAEGGFWTIQKWYVIHHLSFISCELFMKSFKAIECLGEPTEDYIEVVNTQPSYKSHSLQVSNLERATQDILLKSLTPEQCALLNDMNKEAGTIELSMGRYPFEPPKGDERSSAVFPVGEAGRFRATSWLTVARALRGVNTWQ